MSTWLIDPTQRTLTSALDGLAFRGQAVAAKLATSSTPGAAPVGADVGAESFASILADATSASASTSDSPPASTAAPAASTSTGAADATVSAMPKAATATVATSATTETANLSAAGSAGSGSSAWGAPIDLSSPSIDTYTLARQWYYAIENPSAAPAGSVFSQASSPGPVVASWHSGAPGGPTPSYGAFQLRQLLDQFNTQGTAYWPTGVYPAIPSDVFTAAGWAGAYDTRGQATQVVQGGGTGSTSGTGSTGGTGSTNGTGSTSGTGSTGGTGSTNGTGSTGSAGSGSSAWGAPIDLSSPSIDTYTLARQWYYAIENPSAAPAGSVFSQASSPGPVVASWHSGAPGGPTPSYGAFQLRQLLDQFNTQGTAYWPTGVYPAIPSDVFTAAGWAGAYDTRSAG